MLNKTVMTVLKELTIDNYSVNHQNDIASLVNHYHLRNLNVFTRSDEEFYKTCTIFVYLNHLNIANFFYV